MKKMKKIAAILLAMVMVLGMSLTAFAAEPSNEDKANVIITGISGNPTVTLYQIAKGNYDTDGQGLLGYTWANGVSFTMNKETKAYEPTVAEITNVANGLVGGTITSMNTVTDESVGETYTQEVAVGAYIAVITGAEDGSIYNPIFLTVSYNGEGKLVEGKVNANSFYAYGTTAVAKKSTPSIPKEIVGGTTMDGEKHTAGVGSKVDFQLSPVMPSYPANAVNKTFFVSDTMSAGLTFDYASLNIKVGDTTLTKDGESFKLGDAVVAVSDETENGFNLNFDYDTLIGDNGAVTAPVITYSAVVNENAVVGNPGNPNHAELYYTNTPNKGQDWDDVTEKPDEADGIVKKEDKEIIYTYQLSFLKTGEGEGEDADGLAGAVFGIYTNEDCTILIDKVTTNENGYAVSTNVKSGTYYVKELVAPEGYSLNTTVYPMTANWSTATTKDTATVTDVKYTSERPSDDAVQVGWIKDGKFYEMDEFTEASDTVKVAYLASTTTTTTSTSTITKNTDGGGTVSLADAIPNTKLVSLPSTGGIGTTIFTIVGCLVMVAAAGMFFVSRRRENA